MDTQLSGLCLVLAAVCLVVGTIGIANATVVAVLERTGEIGLRRAMGALPRHIAAQFLIEAAVLGAVGGLTGTSIGVVAVVITCAVVEWTAVISPLLIVTGPLIGLAVSSWPASIRRSGQPGWNLLRRFAPELDLPCPETRSP